MGEYVKINILACDKNMLEFEIIDDRYTISELLTGKLSDYDGVDFVAYDGGHPLIDKQKIIIKTKNKNALELTFTAIEELNSDLKEMKKFFKKTK